MRELCNDLLVSGRLFSRSPALAASVALAVGVGVGATIAIFALLHDMFIAASPFHDPGRILIIENTGRYYYQGRMSEGLASPKISGPDWMDIEAQSRTFAAIGAVAQYSGVMTGGDRPRPIWRTLASPQLFTVLGARPRLGRLLDESDFKAGATPAAVLTESMWRRHFSSDPGVVGRTIRIDDQPFAVVGVLPDSVLRFLRRPEGILEQVQDRQVISPLLAGMAGGEARLFRFVEHQRDAPWVLLVGRLAPGHNVSTTQQELSLIAARLAAEHPASNARRGLQARSLDAWRSEKVRGTMVMLLSTALLVFCVASFNAAGLMLGDSVRHESEMAVREALGAGSVRLVRLQLIRSMVLALPGGIVALLVAFLPLLLLDRTLAGGSGAILRALVLPRVILVGMAMTAIAGLVAGASVAWTTRHRNLAHALKEGGMTLSAGRRRQFVTRGLVGLQVAAATALVLGAGLMLRSVWNIVAVDLGFDVRQSFVIELRLPPSRYPTGARQREFFKNALRRVRTVAGVASAGVTATAPLTDTSMGLSGVEIEMPTGETRAPETLNAQTVTPGYLEALNMRLVRGRWFDDRDSASGQAALVDQAFCEKYLDRVDPLQVRIRLPASVPIVGIVGNARRDGPLADPQPMLYMLEPFNRPSKWSFLVVRTTRDPAQVGGAVLREVLAQDPAVSANDPQLLSELFAETFATRRRLLMLLGSAASLVLALTGLSLLSALSQFISVRSREIAIRLALGADRGHVTRLLGRHMALTLAAGIAIGSGVGLVLADALSAELFGVSPFDLTMWVQSGVLIALLATLASVAPLWRASRTDITSVLRAE